MDKNEYMVWLTLLKGVGPVTQRHMLQKMCSSLNIYNASAGELEHVCGLSKKAAELVCAGSKAQNALDPAKRILHRCSESGVRILTFENPLYPFEAAASTKMPILLYYRGTLIPNSMGIAIVGSRRCSDYAKDVACEAASFLAQNNIPVISGLAKGIDGYAHTACLNSGGYTLAFLAGGPDICYPTEHEPLYRAIIENGAVLSEHPPGTKPFYRQFARRNFLMSSWSRKVFVVQAGQKSGALITAEYAFKSKKEVLSLPDRIYEKSSAGSNSLLLLGAKVYLNKKQLIEGVYAFQNRPAANYESSRAETQAGDQSAVESEILNVISKSAYSSDKISIMLSGKYTVSEIEETLFNLEMCDKVSLRAGLWHVKPK
ncbi:DNA processing protein [Peptoclostridium litorale DSM 5388]|uniref:Protein Smf n=1 Tax=Peptoclostridium litorale DSM 5388 TaxID=1121324 RepID=A0A069RKB6_PEPLI|nr:DNA-processing protein DprA [Peptoclostridium litorale]KDR94637.1 protein Smf [Peptoclostridium litorale DSM 5388]SIO30485.1 DNA processing protein [Peptoclostridium litorale DSM 5388]